MLDIENSEADVAPAISVRPAVSALAASTLAACAGSGTPSTVIVIQPTAAEAARFLSQASMGANKEDIARVQTLGYEAWLNEEFSATGDISHWDWLLSKGFNADTFRNTQQGIDASLWRKLIGSKDLLRQRVTFALLEIFVVSIDGLNSNWRAFMAGAYMDLLEAHAFSDFRNLIGKISTIPAMGVYLTFRGNTKANVAKGSFPDENYAREILQLFTIGLYELNMDGTPKLANDKPIETYQQEDITGLARVFTGWDHDGTDNTTPDRYRRPMVQIAARHELGEKKFLTTTIPAGTDGMVSMQLALDGIVAHPNVPPFFCKQLIQRLVTSNPSPAYVGRVVHIFKTSSGDLKATIKAILLDDEARNSTNLANAHSGKLREPILRFTAFAKAFGVSSPSGAWLIGNTSNPANRLGQSPLRSPSVFNFFRPGYVPPNSGFSQQNLVAPEFQITNESSVAGYINFMQLMVSRGLADVSADYTNWLPLVDDTQKLLDELNLVLAAGQLQAATITSLKTAIDTIATTTSAGKSNRLYAAITLVLASPEFILLK